MCTLQAKLWCTTRKAKIVAVILIASTLTYEAIDTLFSKHKLLDLQNILAILPNIIRLGVPVAVLVINVVVAVQVRRAASNAAVHLGVQPHHQQTSSSNNSAVPTAMLVATSIIYAVLYGTAATTGTIAWWVWNGDFSYKTRMFATRRKEIVLSVVKLVFAYNFYVYLITGRQFRAELRKLLCRCLPSSTTDADAHLGA